MPSIQRAIRKISIGQTKGQIILEYILLLFIVVTAVTFITKSLVGRSEGQMGVLIQSWSEMIQIVGQDRGD